VRAGDVQPEFAQVRAVGAQAEDALEVRAGAIAHLHGGLRVRAIADGAALHFGQDALHVFVVQAEDGRSIERHLVDELDEGRAISSMEA